MELKEKTEKQSLFVQNAEKYLKRKFDICFYKTYKIR